MYNFKNLYLFFQQIIANVFTFLYFTCAVCV